ncbi:MAG: hypothetical protein B6D70_07675 [gamma proteobacterium symbiont of Stewartia floridana]|nr:MAG: hypothetical protein B6D70_07675 [gamma proteobacterium symbiont of Stewartia floridana]
MGRKRKSNKDLPQRVYFRNGAYYFVSPPPQSKWIRLGKKKGEMYAALARLNLTDIPCFTMRDVWKRYAEEVLPGKAISSQLANKAEAEKLLAVFGDMHPDAIKPQDIAEYLDVRGKNAPTKANREIGLLSHMFTKAVRWGVAERNPCLRVERNKTRPRERYVEDWEFEEFLKVAPEQLTCYLELKYLTSLRKTDLLLMTFASIKDEGIFVRPSKTKNSAGEPRLFVWNDDLREVIERIKRLPRPVTCQYLFCRQDGRPLIEADYTTPAFGYLWQKTMKKALAETELLERFQERDIRAKSATDADDQGIDATELLGHGDRRTTKIYIRGKKAKRVQALTFRRDSDTPS